MFLWFPVTHFSVKGYHTESVSFSFGQIQIFGYMYLVFGLQVGPQYTFNVADCRTGPGILIILQ